MKWSCTLTLLHLLIVSASAEDTLLQGQSIRDGESLVSSSLMFELGFFSPGNSSNRYVGIWYHNIPEQTVVWVANRDRPIFDRSGKLTFTTDGHLMVVDGIGAAIVFTYGSSLTHKHNTTAKILDTGNFVLSHGPDGTSVILWQSFDYPTDHLLPGMLLGMVGDQNRLLTSWKGSDDPSMGDFSFGANPNGTKQFFIWQQNRVYWDTGLWMGNWYTGAWTGNYFSLATDLAIMNFFFFYYVSFKGSDYLTYDTDNNVVGRLTINHNGQFSLLIWSDSNKRWDLRYNAPRIQCDVINVCGAFGVCNSNHLPFCDCLKGFQPSSLSDWRKRSTDGGCVRETGLQCQSGGKLDGFQSVPHVKFPINGVKSNEVEAGQCKSSCLKNCTCSAYAYTDMCWLWYGDIATLQLLDQDDGTNNFTGTLYVRLAASEFVESKKKLKIIVALIVVFVSFSCILIGSFLCWRRHKGQKRLSQEQSILLLGAEIAKKLGQNDKRAPEFTLFDFSRIVEATNSFSNENKLGQGGFGPVYKGTLSEGQEIAVKRLSTRSGQGLEEFKNEILLIAKLQHSNLVRLLGCCIQREEKILIYEYMQNKSLDFFLFDKERGSQLGWSRRFHIIEGIAQGLIYLHKHSRLRIIHRDLKASNVLLDAEMNPKISDFGMARIFNPNETLANTIRVVGTYGYMSPEYVREGKFSVKSDVFSFGVLLLEIVSGKRNTSFHQYKNALNLVGYTWELWLKGRLSDLRDPSPFDICPRKTITRCIHVALLCVQEKAVDRPTMTEVITMLSSDTAALADPKQPAFFSTRVPRETDLPRKTSSVNNVTVTSIDGR